jgi:two-component system chemotaxis response regulator CheB
MSAVALRRPGDGPRLDSAERPIRVLLVDDSLVARTVLSRLLEGNPQFEIAGALPSADRAISFLKTDRADIVVLDVEMPGKDGLTALPEILDACEGTRVLIVSSSAEAGASATVRALTLGAADTLLKPTAGNFGGEFSKAFVNRLLRLGHAAIATDDIVARQQQRQRREAASEWADHTAVRLAPAVASGPVACLAIGASTGGLHALSAFLKRLPKSFSAPILITQHLPPVFMP